MQPNLYRKVIKIGSFTSSDIELKDLAKAWIAISFAFAVLLRGSVEVGFFFSFFMSGLTVGLGFLLHELGHKVVAQKYGCFAEFRANNIMLILAIVMSFIGFILAAPGAVMIAGQVDRSKNGRIAIIWSIINLLLAAFFYIASFLYSHIFLDYGVSINAWLALFNMLPFGILDGYKVWKWNKLSWSLVVITALLFLFVL